MKILIIEDEVDLARALQKGLIKNGYAVDIAVDGAEGFELYKINSYDLIVLDLNLPSMDGLEILRAIRKDDKLQRIIILSARGAIDDRILGLDMGANDYLPKPFDFGELCARVRSLLCRSFTQESREVQCGELRLDTSAKEIFFKETKLDITSREYSLLEYLTLNAGRVVSAEELIEHVWSSETDYFSAAVKVHISNLRKKLKDMGGEELILTARGQGYLIEKMEKENVDK